jgi:hypothetical protein
MILLNYIRVAGETLDNRTNWRYIKTSSGADQLGHSLPK